MVCPFDDRPSVRSEGDDGDREDPEVLALDVLLEGETFTAEPGLYADELKGGIRIENDYLVTKTGVENLNRSPIGLV